MKQNELSEKVQQKYEDVSFLSFFQPQSTYLKFNRFKLETFQQPKDPSPWLDTQRHLNSKPHLTVQNSPVFRIPAHRARVESYRTHTEIKKKKRFQETISNFKLNNTFVEFSVKFKSKNINHSTAKVEKSRSSQVRSVLAKNRLEMVKRQNEEQGASKTPKIKFLQRKFRIKEGTSSGVRAKLSQNENQAGKEESLLTLQAQPINAVIQSISKANDQKKPIIRPIHSKQIRSKWAKWLE